MKIRHNEKYLSYDGLNLQNVEGKTGYQYGIYVFTQWTHENQHESQFDQ